VGGGARIGEAPGSLIGRADDLGYIAAFADRAAVSGDALLLSGEAGVGKTVLLDAAAAHAEAAGRGCCGSPAPNLKVRSASPAFTSCCTRCWVGRGG
jgi:tRNA A37 threonylcarbamoyladenosine biosynthesis protein TsaE